MAILKRYACIAFLACLAPRGAPAHEGDRAEEYEIKAAFLFNFAKFVEWPAGTFANAGEPITIGVLGSDPFGRLLEETMEGKTVNGRSLRLRRYDAREEHLDCQILFIGVSEEPSLEQVMQRLEGARVLTVSESESFLQRGGMIQFEMRDNRVHLAINAERAARSGLHVSAKLLTLARIVKDASHGGER